MAKSASVLQRMGWGLAVMLGLLAPPALAQDQSQPRSAILTIDQDALFQRTLFGKALLMAAEQEAAALKAESRSIDAALEAEERSLTDRRAGMPVAEFRALADAFDIKVEALRTTQDAKLEAFIARREAARQQFFQKVAPMIGDYMVEQGASAIVNQAAIVVSLGAIDITDEVIARIDDLLGDGVTTRVLPKVAPPDAVAPVAP